MVEAYLAEMRSLPGFSGSPVFVYIGPASYRGNEKMMPFYSETIGLLGIDTGHKPLTNPVLDAVTGEPAEPPQNVQQNSGVAIIAPYYKIGDVLKGDRFIEQRKQADQEALADPERGTSDIAGDRPEEFENFEDLTRTLANTPKEELDEKRKDDG